MQVETCPRCGKPVAVESGTGFHCCLACQRRLLGYTWWSTGSGRPVSLPLFRTAAEAQAAAEKAGAPNQVSPLWSDVGDAVKAG
jgi:hypothetical protein